MSHSTLAAWSSELVARLLTLIAGAVILMAAIGAVWALEWIGYSFAHGQPFLPSNPHGGLAIFVLTVFGALTIGVALVCPLAGFTTIAAAFRPVHRSGLALRSLPAHVIFVIGVVVWLIAVWAQFYHDVCVPPPNLTYACDSFAPRTIPDEPGAYLVATMAVLLVGILLWGMRYLDEGNPADAIREGPA